MAAHILRLFLLFGKSSLGITMCVHACKSVEHFFETLVLRKNENHGKHSCGDVYGLQ